MPQMTKAKKRRAVKTFAKAIAEGKSQVEAYHAAFPNASGVTAKGNASRYANMPAVKIHIEEALSKVSEADVGAVVGQVVKDAKRRTNSDSATIASREHFFKLSGHPAFSNKVDVSVGKAEVPDGLLSQLSTMLDRLDAIAGKMAGGHEPLTDFVDVDYQPAPEEKP